MKTTILITGATGYVGRLLAHHLIKKGYKLRCMVRDKNRLEKELFSQVETCEADVLDTRSLAFALDGIETVYYLIHSMGASKGKFKDIDKTAAHNFARAASEAGVKRIIYLGGLGSDKDKLSEHLKSRHETGEILRSYPVPVTEFRAGSIVGSGSLSFEMIRYLVERLPVLICPRWVNGITQPVAIEDVLNFLSACLNQPETKNKIYEIGGRDKLSYLEMMKTYARIRGLKRWFINVPVLTPHLSSLWLGFITPLPVRIAKPLVHGITNDLYCRNTDAEKVFSFPRMSYEEAVGSALTAQRAQLLQSGIANGVFKYKDDRKRLMQVEKAEGAIIERWQRSSKLPPEVIFKRICRCGGSNGWPASDKAFRFRMFIDRLLGGEAQPRRPAVESLERGDKIDFWEVLEIKENSYILLGSSGIKIPGKVWLRITLEQTEGGSRVKQMLVYEPKGLGGEIYYFLLQAPHKDIFTNLINAFAKDDNTEHKS